MENTKTFRALALACLITLPFAGWAADEGFESLCQSYTIEEEIPEAELENYLISCIEDMKGAAEEHSDVSESTAE